MNIKQLRQTILDRAIRGQLVSQDPTDEPTSVLLERIRAEKEQLIKDKKLKREKRDNQPIEEVPFEIPEGWVWCRLGEIAYIASGSTPKSTSFVDKGIPYLKVYNLRNQVIDFDYKAQYIKESIHNGILKRSKTEIGDLIMNIVGPPLGKLAIIPTSLPESNFNQAAVLIRPYLHKNIINKYLFYFLSEMSEINSISTKGSAGQVNISLSQAKDMKIPLPPLKEQHRIVQKIEQLFALVDIIEVNKKALEKLIEQAKSQVLSDAVAGKLTHQDPNDEPAEELLKRIGKTTAPDTPYEKLPKGWAWCKLGDIGEILTGNTPSKGERAFYGNDFPFFKPNDLDIGKVETSLDSLSVLGYKQARKVPKGSILVTCIGSIGKTGITQVEGAFNQQINAIIPFECIDNYFIYYLMLSKEIQEQLNTKASATTIAILNKSKFENTLIPLPPLAEQHRIVKKIETYFSFFDTIESNL
ncbi:restriction endonuclease subunit S [Capnocytophaga leadbetteri]